MSEESTPADRAADDIAIDVGDDTATDVGDDAATDAGASAAAEPPITLIAAVAANGVIGVDGGMPWHLPADLRRFKRLTRASPPNSTGRSRDG